MMQANLHGQYTAKRETSINIFSHFNISKETFDGKIKDKSNKPNSSKWIKTATISDVNQNANAFHSAQKYVLKNLKNIAIGHLSSNFLRNKITEVKELITNKIDICMISETKLDQSFLNEQFQIIVRKGVSAPPPFFFYPSLLDIPLSLKTCNPPPPPPRGRALLTSTTGKYQILWW